MFYTTAHEKQQSIAHLTKLKLKYCGITDQMQIRVKKKKLKTNKN